MAQHIMPSDGTASELMWNAAMGGGGPYVHCACGTTHTIPEPEKTDDDDEYGYNDQTYYDYNSFSYVHVDGQEFVYECDGCRKKLAKYEKFIWDNRDTIRRYLNIRVAQEKIWADQEVLMNKLLD